MTCYSAIRLLAENPTLKPEPEIIKPVPKPKLLGLTEIGSVMVVITYKKPILTEDKEAFRKELEEKYDGKVYFDSVEV